MLKKNLLAISCILLAVSCSSHYFTSSENSKQDRYLFGVPFRSEAPSEEKVLEIDKKISELEPIYREVLDPDCRWRSSVNGKCPQNYEKEVHFIEHKAKKLKEETLGYFDIHHQGKRDLDGLSEGHILELLKQDITPPWLINFAGDLFFTGGFEPDYPMTISDPLHSQLTFAVVQMDSGWMTAGTSRMLGAQVRNPKTQKVWREDFQMIVLFASPSFDGTRLDVWSTAIMAGGRKLLKHLWSNENKNWAYLYFDNKGEPYCSDNLKCLWNEQPRKVIVPPW